MNSKNDKELLKKVPQIFIVRASGHTHDMQRLYPQWELSNNDLKRLLINGVGGVILLGGSTTEVEQRCKLFKTWASAPLLLCADLEEGVGQRFAGGTRLVPPMALGKIFSQDRNKGLELAYKYGQCTGKQAKLCGLNWVLGPVCDVNNNKLNPAINVRAWGEDPFTVSALASAFHKGVSSQGVLTCAKHFPGHGDTEVDSHLTMPRINKSKSELLELELIPFKAAIAAGIDSVMTAHLIAPYLDSNLPATLSKKIITNLLRKELNFHGLVITDALIMNSICQNYGAGQAAVMAFAAGADLLLMPSDVDIAIAAITNELEAGRIPMQRLESALARRERSMRKIQEVNISTHPEHASLLIESNLDRQLASELIKSSIEFANIKEIENVENGVNLIRVDNFFTCNFLTSSSPSIKIPSMAGFEKIIYHRDGVSIWQNEEKSSIFLERMIKRPILLQIFARGNPFEDNSFLEEKWSEVISKFEACKKLAGVVIYGSPYLWEELIPRIGSSTPAAYSPGQMNEAQKEILTKLFKTTNQFSIEEKSKKSTFTD